MFKNILFGRDNYENFKWILYCLDLFELIMKLIETFITYMGILHVQNNPYKYVPLHVLFACTKLQFHVKLFWKMSSAF